MRSLVKFFALSLGVLSSLALVSCNKSEQPTTSTENPTPSPTVQSTQQLPREGLPAGVQLADQQVLNLTLFTKQPAQDLHLLQDWSDFYVYRNIYEPLLRVGRDGSYIPAAAQSYEKSADGLTWTFHLQPKAQWQDGKPVTAHDFVYAWQRLVTNPNTAFRSLLSDLSIVNASQIIAGTAQPQSLGIEALDDYTLQIHLEHPIPWLESIVSIPSLAPLRADLITDHPNDWYTVDNVVGNGAYKLVSNSASKIVLEKSPTYWNKDNVVITQVNYNILSSQNAIFSRFHNKQLDGFFSNYELVADETVDPEVKILYSPTHEHYYQFNLERIPEQDVRQAIAILLPHDLQENGFVPYDKFAPETLAEAQEIHPYSWSDLNLEERSHKAQELLNAHGYTAEHPLKIRYSLPKAFSIVTEITRYMSELANKAVVFEPVQTLISSYDEMKQYNLDMSFTGWAADYKHISNFANLMTCANSFSGSYCNKEYDNLVQQAAKEPNSEKRMHLYAQAVDILNREVPLMYFIQQKFSYVFAPKVRGFTQENIDTITVQDLYLVK